MCFDFDWPSGDCYRIFRGSVVRPCGEASFGEISCSVAWDWTSGGCPHDITDSYLLKMTLEPWSRVLSVVCSHAFGLAKYLDTLTDGGGVMPTPECRNPNPYGMVCVCVRVCVCRGTAFRRMLCMDSCHSVSGMPWFAGDFSLMPWTCASGHHL